MVEQKACNNRFTFGVLDIARERHNHIEGARFPVEINTFEASL